MQKIQMQEIQIEGQKEFTSKYTIDRKLHDSLANHLLPNEWTDFCNNIDYVLLKCKPSLLKKRFTYIMMGLYFLVFVVGLTYLNASHLSKLAMVLVVIMFIMCWIMVFLFQRSIRKVVQEDLQKMCIEESKRFKSLSFRVRKRYSRSETLNITQKEASPSSSNRGSSFDLVRLSLTDRFRRSSSNEGDHKHLPQGKGFYYIECRIKASDEESISIDGVSPVIATASILPPSKARTDRGLAWAPQFSLDSSPVQRLSDLERAKSFLTAKEFEQKREEIISQL